MSTESQLAVVGDEAPEAEAWALSSRRGVAILLLLSLVPVDAVICV